MRPNARRLYASPAAHGAAPVLLYDFTTGSLPTGATLTRASAGTFTNSSGVMAAATSDEARFEHHPVTLACLGLLCEPARTNIVRNSEDMVDGFYWTALNTAGLNAQADPFNTADAAAQITAAAGTNAKRWLAIVGTSITAAAQYAHSVYAKYDNHQHVHLSDRSDAAIHSTTADLVGSSILGSSNGTGAIEDGANGFKRISLRQTRTNTSVAQIVISHANAAHTTDTPSVVAAGAERGVYACAQIEVGEYPTSYIPTLVGGATVTRAADVVAIDHVGPVTLRYTDGSATAFTADGGTTPLPTSHKVLSAIYQA